MSDSSYQQPNAVPSMQVLHPQQQQSYASDVPTTDPGVYGCLMAGLGEFLGFFGSIPLCFCFPNPYSTIQQGNVGLLTRWGRFYRCLDPGLYKVNPISENLMTVDVKISVEDIPPQYVMTRDNCSIKIDSVLYWHIVDPYTAQYKVSNVRKALIERTQTTLRHIIGTRTLQDAIENRETIAHEIQHIIEEPAAMWGVKIESILIKDLQFSLDLQETLSAAAKQKRIGESKVIAAQAEVEAAKLMREASDILNTNAAMQIRYLETLTQMSRNAGTKVIFMPPAPDGGGRSRGLGVGNDGPFQSVLDTVLLETAAGEREQLLGNGSSSGYGTTQ